MVPSGLSPFCFIAAVVIRYVCPETSRPIAGWGEEDLPMWRVIRKSSVRLGIGAGALMAAAWMATCLPSVVLAEPAERLRLFIETDAGGDPDDEQSLVRFLVSANEWDVEGIACTCPETRRGENLNPAPNGLAIVQRMLDAYAECWPRLKEHASFPEPDILRRVTVDGTDASDAAVALLVAAVDRDDPRPLWFSNWGTDDGTTSCLRRALDKVLRERGPEGYAAFKSRLRLCSDDRFGPHTREITPAWPIWVYTKLPDMDGGRWYHRFGPLTATAGGFDLERDVRTGHGPLGALYPTNTTIPQKEGDTPEFLYLLPNGLGDPEEPSWGSWAGRFGAMPDADGRPYFAPNVRDTREGVAHRDHTLDRWAADLQNDFSARMDWCVLPFADANHPPQVRLRGSGRPSVQPGGSVALDVSESSDPDGDALHTTWVVYPEPGSSRGPLPVLENANRPIAVLHVPDTAMPGTIHCIAVVRDDGEPKLTRYARVVVAVTPTDRSAREP